MFSSPALPDELIQVFNDGQAIKSQSYRGRFAPTPSGPLHLGNLRTALISWIRARLNGGVWLLRIDDLDTPRNRLGAIQSIQDDLLWLGMNWDAPIVFQSQRIDFYRSLLDAFQSQGRLYACRCSRRLLAKRNGLQTKSFVYPGTCRNLNLPWSKYRGIYPSLRLRVSGDFVETCGDVVLRRADGFIAYHLATVADELALGINEVVRGRDLADSMHAQLAVIDALGQEPLTYKHVPLLMNSDGEKLSKRFGGKGLKALQKEGWGPSNVIGLLASDLDLVPERSQLTLSELLIHLKDKTNKIEELFAIR